MAGWLNVLKVVPWSDVINAAPKLAGGARKLWDAVGKKSPPPQAAPAAAAAEDPVAALRARLDRTESTVADLGGQMLSATELIAKLADQNTQLVAEVETLRVRVLWLTVAAGIALVAAVVAIFLR